MIEPIFELPSASDINCHKNPCQRVKLLASDLFMVQIRASIDADVPSIPDIHGILEWILLRSAFYGSGKSHRV